MPYSTVEQDKGAVPTHEAVSLAPSSIPTLSGVVFLPESEDSRQSRDLSKTAAGVFNPHTAFLNIYPAF
jgi:hypothetical protein